MLENSLLIAGAAVLLAGLLYLDKRASGKGLVPVKPSGIRGLGAGLR